MSKYPKLPFVKPGALNITLYQKARKMEKIVIELLQGLDCGIKDLEGMIVKEGIYAPSKHTRLQMLKILRRKYHDQFLEKE